MRLISETLRKLRIYEKEYRKGTLGRMIEGTEDILKEAADAIEKMSEKLKENNLNNAWIPCNERMPEEHDSIFKKWKGTDKWNNAMFEKDSDDVNVTVEFEDGTRKTRTAHTLDGRWNIEKGYLKRKVIAWQPLPEPYKEEKL